MTQDYLINWLECLTSLTERLEKYSGEARLDVITSMSELKSNKFGDQENSTLSKGINYNWGEAYFEREILMWSHQLPCWYAKTCIPERTWFAQAALFQRLRYESLGALIYHNPKIVRSTLNYYQINKQSKQWAWLKPEWFEFENVLWMRVSELVCDEQDSFYLYEIFLPGLLRYCYEENFGVLVSDKRT